MGFVRFPVQKATMAINSIKQLFPLECGLNLQSAGVSGGRIERVMLWRFLLNLLEDSRNSQCIHWVQRDEGIFRIVNTDWLARLWGRRHGNPRMTYEKMARAMR